MNDQSFLYGAVLKLTRDDTLNDIRKNLEQMKQSGFNTVVVWPAVYWWEEKKEGYPFNTGRALLRIAEEIGIHVIMELAGQLPVMEYIPDFQMKDEYYCVDAHGRKRIDYGSYGWLNYCHPEVDKLICENFRQTAKAYKDYPSLIGYDVFNETAFNSFDSYTMEYFRIWLKEKYGTIEKLNDSWEHSYTDFTQVSFTPWMWMSIMPAADWGAFRKDNVCSIIQRWCDAIRSVDNTRPLIADNISAMVVNSWSYEQPQDDFGLKEVVDEIGMSFYPKGTGGTQPTYTRWNAFDGFYAASKREGFFVSEMQTHTQAMFNPTTAVRPYELKQWCCEALAAGIKGLIYWMWRPFDKGLQTYGRGLVDYRNHSTPRLEFAKKFSKTISETGALTPVRSKVGILYDAHCQDFQICYTKCYKVDKNIYINSLQGAYRALYEAGLRADIIKLNELDKYKVAILSNHIVISDETAKKLTEFVLNGGTVICDGKTGIVDEFARMHKALPGGSFQSMMGLELLDSDYENLEFKNGLIGSYCRELTAVTDGTILAEFSDGYPAVVQKNSGKGKVVTINTNLWHGAFTGEGSGVDFAQKLAEKYGDITVTAPLKVRVSENDDTRYAFVFNYTDSHISGRLKGCGFDCSVEVEANDVVLVKGDKI